MDFVKTLLIYMTLTFAMGVQAAPTPEVTVAPTPAATAVPTAIVAQAKETPGALTELGTATPAPATTPPAPTMTPNKAYKVLRFGDKGANVKKLQTRLKELGYLSGNVDGSYGSQTKKAVVAFQKANGLHADGDAGPITLTMLYENPNVVSNPLTTTPSPVPTATPDANGMIPVGEDPLSLWTKMGDMKILLNGEVLYLPNGAKPQLWRRGREYMLDLSALAVAAPDWTLSDLGAAGFTLNADGYQVNVKMKDAIAAARSSGDDSYCDMYNVWVNSVSVSCAQGDLVSEKGTWYVTDGLLRRMLRCEITVDEEDNACVIVMAGKSAAESAD